MKKSLIKQKQLALDWARGQVTLTKVQKKLNKSPMGTYIVLATTLREIIQTEPEAIVNL